MAGVSPWTARVKALAIEAGFDRVGVARAHDRPDDLRHLRDWIGAGHHGPMAWMAKDPERRCDPRRVVDGARSVLVVALDYDCEAPLSTACIGPRGDAAPPGHGWVSRYAWGDDYHEVVEARLKRWAAAVADEIGAALPPDFRGDGVAAGPWDGRRDFRWEVDYGPMLERRWAEEAGLGWQGKHSLLVDPARGSFFFLATVVTTLALEPDAPLADHCGTCTRCIDACPTAAIVAPRVVDARRCISTLTIETRGAWSEAQGAMVGDAIFGCDICQDVCPFQRFRRPSGEAAFAPRPGMVLPQLASFPLQSDEEFAAGLRRSPLRRARRAGLERNIAAVRENQRRRGAEGGADGPSDG